MTLRHCPGLKHIQHPLAHPRNNSLRNGFTNNTKNTLLWSLEMIKKNNHSGIFSWDRNIHVSLCKRKDSRNQILLLLLFFFLNLRNAPLRHAGIEANILPSSSERPTWADFSDSRLPNNPKKDIDTQKYMCV